MNPIGLVLVAGGLFAIIVGIRGSQSATWSLLFGRGSDGSKPEAPSSSVGAPMSPTTHAPAVLV